MISAVSVHVNPNLPWYIARSAGIVAWALITASVIWGLSFSGKLTRHPKLPSPAWMLDLHRFLGGMAVIFTGLHIVGLMMDKYVGYGPVQVVLPLTGTYRPVAVAWGIVAAYLLIAIELTSLVMGRLPRKVWHGIHLTSFVVFTLGTVHGLSTGTDARHGILPLIMVLAAIVVAMLTGMRAQIAIAKRTERAARAQRGGRPAPGARPVRAPVGDGPVRERPVREPAVAQFEEDEDRPVRQRPVREPAVARSDAPGERPPRQPAGRPGGAPGAVRSAPRTAVERAPRMPVPAADAGERPMAPSDGGYQEHFRPPAPAYEPAAYGPAPGAPAPGAPYADPRYAAGPYPPDPRYPAGPYADPRYAAGPYPDPRYPAGPYPPDPRYPAAPYADPRVAGPAVDPRYALPPGYAPRAAPPAAPPAPTMPRPPVMPAAPPAAAMPPAAPTPPPSPYLRGAADSDDDVHDAEIVEDQAEAVGQSSFRPPAREASVHPLRPVPHAARPVRPRPVPSQGEVPGFPRRTAAPGIPTASPTSTPPAMVPPAPGRPEPVFHVPADGRGADQRPLPVEQRVAADGRGPGVPRISADGRPVAESDIPSERVSGRLP